MKKQIKLDLSLPVQYKKGTGTFIASQGLFVLCTYNSRILKMKTNIYGHILNPNGEKIGSVRYNKFRRAYVGYIQSSDGEILTFRHKYPTNMKIFLGVTREDH